MKKIISFLILMFLVSVCFADEFKFLGIPFDSTKEEVISMMQEKGWTLNKKKSNRENLSFTGNTYAGKKIYSISMSFNDNKFTSVLIMFDDTKFDGAEVFAALIDKYQLEKIDGYDILYRSKDKKNLFNFIRGSIIITGGTLESENPLDVSDL